MKTMMVISIARKNLPSLLLKNPNSNVHLFLSINCFSFSTSRAKKSILNPEIYDLLFQKHQFSSEFASSIASAHLTKSSTPERADSVLSFLKENSFTNSQLEKIFRYKPLILGYNVEGLQLKLKIFRDLGLSSEEVAKMMSSNQSLIYMSTKNNILPKLSILKALLGSDQDVARLLTKSSWFLHSKLDKTLIPNVEILKSSGIPMELVRRFLHTSPRRLLIKPDIMKKSVDRAIEFGVPRASAVFIHAVTFFAHTNREMWEAKLQTLHDLGFSDVEMILTMFRRQPNVFLQSQNKLKSAVELLVGIGKYSISDIVACPSTLGISIKKRLEPRLHTLGFLASKNLIKQWPAISVLQYKDDKFFDKFVNPYYDEIGEESITRRFCRGQRNSISEEGEEDAQGPSLKF